MIICCDFSQDDDFLLLMLFGGYIVMVNKFMFLINMLLLVKKMYYWDDFFVVILVVGLVCENDLVFFDNGLEMLLVISMILDDIIFIGICYLYWVFIVLNEKFNVMVILCGGIYWVKSDVFYDVNNFLVLDLFNLCKVFIFVSGVYEYFGVSWFNLDDFVVKCKVMECGLCKILLVCYVLFDEVVFVSIGLFFVFDVLISDCLLLIDYVVYCWNGFVKVIMFDLESE